MKKSILFAAFAALVLCSCGASKQAAVAQQQSPAQYVVSPSASKPVKTTEVEEDIDECEEKSYDWSDGMIKAYASAVNPDRDFARTQAVTLARAELAASVRALVTNVIKSYRNSVAKDKPTKSTFESQITQTADVMADEVLAFTGVLCSKRFKITDENGLSYRACVCVAMRNNFEQALEEKVIKLSDDDVIGVKFREDQFRKSYKEELEAYRQQKMNK